MTIGEKIKCFRTLEKMTQKTLGEKTGIGEATIRKYELGIRNPKPAQIKKIAHALNIGENLLLDVSLSSLSLETLGDAMALFFTLEHFLGITYYVPEKSPGVIDREKFAIRFDNKEFTELLCKWVEELRTSENGMIFMTQNESSIDAEDCERFQELNKAILEETKQSLIQNKTPIK